MYATHSENAPTSIHITQTYCQIIHFQFLIHKMLPFNMKKVPFYVSLPTTTTTKKTLKKSCMKGRFFFFFSYHKGCALNRRNAFLFWSVGTEILRGKQLGVFSVFQVMLIMLMHEPWFTLKIETRRRKKGYVLQATYLNPFYI